MQLAMILCRSLEVCADVCFNFSATAVRRLHRVLHAQIREGGRLPEQGSGHATGVLRLPGRAMETPADDYRAPPHDPIEGLPVQQDDARDGLQTARRRAE